MPIQGKEIGLLKVDAKIIVYKVIMKGSVHKNNMKILKSLL